MNWWIKCFKDNLKKALLLFIKIYQVFFSPFFGGACRFEPSCSVFAEEVLKKEPSIRAFGLLLKRLIRCRPFGPFGFDPPPSSINGSINGSMNSSINSPINRKTL